MKLGELNWPWVAIAAGTLLLAGCESNKQVGSECRGGVCPRATSVSARACTMSATNIEIRFTGHPDPELQKPVAMCLPRALPTDSAGHIACRMRWTVGTLTEGVGELEAAPPWPVSCDEPFLQPAGEGYADNVCEVKQLSAEEREDGEDGWYYDTSLGDPDAGPDGGICRSGSPGGIRVTEGLRPLSHVTSNVSCSRTLALEDDELVAVDSDECAPPESDASENGAACMPSFASDGFDFDPREAWVEARSNGCNQGACLVFHLHGDPSPDCERSEGKTCPTAEEVERSVYCSCRCDAPEGDPGSLCDCGDGFSCEEILPDGPPGVRGSYCVRDISLSRDAEGGQ